MLPSLSLSLLVWLVWVCVWLVGLGVCLVELVVCLVGWLTDFLCSLIFLLVWLIALWTTGLVCFCVCVFIYYKLLFGDSIAE